MPSSSTRTYEPADGPAAQPGATHPLNVSYLVVGLVFLGIAAMWTLRVTGAIDTHDLGLLLPLILVIAGAVGLLGFTAKGVSRSRRARARGRSAVDDEPAALDDLWQEDPDASR